MNIEAYREAIPEIELRIRELQPHAIVMGLGPSAWLVPHLDQGLLEGVRLFGCNDAFRIRPVNDLSILDPPKAMLHPNSERGKAIIASMPDRFWIYPKEINGWSRLFNDEQRSRIKPFELCLLPPHRESKKTRIGIPDLKRYPYCHTISSPCGLTSLAWGEGNRRIGVIGVDLLANHHRLNRQRGVLWHFFSHVSLQAHNLGGRICNLSPFSQVKFWKKPWRTEEVDFARRIVTAQPMEAAG